MLQKHIDRAKLWEMRRRARHSALKINHTRALQDTAALKKTCLLLRISHYGYYFLLFRKHFYASPLRLTRLCWQDIFGS